MAKKKTSDPPRHDQVGLISPVAHKLGVNHKTLASAVKAGHVDTVKLWCGSTAIVVSSAKAWAKSPRKRGPKPAE